MENKLEIAQKLVVKDLNLKEPGLIFSSLDKLIDWLATEIKQLIDEDFERMLTVLYRIDVNEEKTKEAFTMSDPSRQLARLIIERELQKVASREKYKDKHV